MANVPAELVRETTRKFITQYEGDKDILLGPLGLLLASGRVPPNLNPEDPDVKRIVDLAKQIHNS